MEGSDDVDYHLIRAVCDGRLERARELINSFGLSYSQTWSEGYVLLCYALENKHIAVAELLLSSGSNVNSNKTYPGFETPLHYAAIIGDVNIVEMLLVKGAYVDVKNEDGQTPLYHAIHKKHVQVCELFLKHGVDVNARVKYDVCPLHVAVEIGCLPIVELLLQHGVDVNVRDYDNKTPLYIAVDKGFLPIVKQLLEYEADVNCVCNKSESYAPLHIAVKHGSKELTMLLLSKKANVDVAGEDNMTPLHIAAIEGHEHIAEDLLKNGANVHATENEDGQTPFHLAIQNKNIKVFELLLKYGVDVNVKDNEDRSPFYFAVQEQCLPIVKQLLEYEPDVNYVDKSRSAPLHIAVKNGSKKLTTMLLSKGANVDVAGEDNMTPLHIAALTGNVHMAKHLLAYGACHNSLTLDQEHTPLHVASDVGNEEVVKVLLKAGSDVNASARYNLTPLLVAVSKGHETVVQLLLKHGADVNSEDKDGRAALELAVTYGYFFIAKNLLERGSDINRKSNRNSLRAAVYRPILYGDQCDQMIEVLLNCGFIVNNDDVNNPKLLHTAVEKGHLKFVEHLLKCGADVNMLHILESRGGFTPLHSAANQKQENVCKLLINYGADVNVQDKKQKTPIFYAILNADVKITNLFLTNGANINDPELLNTAVMVECREIIDVIMQCGAHINGRDADGRTALHYTTLSIRKSFRSGGFKRNTYKFPDVNIRAEIAKLFLSRGADVDTENKLGETALHSATQKGYVKVIKTLLMYNANVNCRTNRDMTPLHLAAENGSVKMSTILLKNGADVNAKKSDGTTALHTATERWYHEVVKVLLAFGANMDSKNNNGITPLGLAGDKSEFLVKCRKEIKKIRSTMISSNANMSFYHVFAKSLHSVAICMRNRNIMQVLKSGNYKTKFPMYTTMIETHFKKAMKRKELLEHAIQIFHFIFINYPQIQHVCTEKILSYLNNQDLRTLINSCIFFRK